MNAAFEGRYGYRREELLGRTVHELSIWDDPADRRLLMTQLRRGGPIRNVITRLRTKAGVVKLTAYSADRIQFDGQTCILAVSAGGTCGPSLLSEAILLTVRAVYFPRGCIKQANGPKTKNVLK